MRMHSKKDIYYLYRSIFIGLITTPPPQDITVSSIFEIEAIVWDSNSLNFCSPIFLKISFIEEPDFSSIILSVSRKCLLSFLLA